VRVDNWFGVLAALSDLLGVDAECFTEDSPNRLKADIVAALTGNYRPEYLFVLKQNLELFDACETQLTACDLARPRRTSAR
jgi:hypothetical protein